jgi:hypothetical protein
LSFVLLDSRHFWDTLEFVTNNLFQVDRKHGCEEIRVVSIIFLVNWNFRDVDAKVFQLNLLLLHVLNGIVLLESQFDNHDCDEKSYNAVHGDYNDRDNVPR